MNLTSEQALRYQLSWAAISQTCQTCYCESSTWPDDEQRSLAPAETQNPNEINICWDRSKKRLTVDSTIPNCPVICCKDFKSNVPSMFDHRRNSRYLTKLRYPQTMRSLKLFSFIFQTIQRWYETSTSSSCFQVASVAFWGTLFLMDAGHF